MSTPRRQPFRIGRMLALAAVCLVIGAVVNLLLAWGPCVRWSSAPQPWTFELPEYLTHWEHDTGDDWGPPVVMSRKHRLLVTSDEGVWDTYEHMKVVGSRHLTVHRFGFPMRSMELRWEITPLSPGFVHDGSALSLGAVHGTFPIRPVFPGTIVNTAFFALAAWGLFQGLAWIGRQRRRRANLCVACGYSRAGIATDVKCPECGAERVARSGTIPA